MIKKDKNDNSHHHVIIMATGVSVDQSHKYLNSSHQFWVYPCLLVSTCHQESLPRELQHIQETRQEIRKVYGKFIETQEDWEDWWEFVPLNISYIILSIPID